MFDQQESTLTMYGACCCVQDLSNAVAENLRAQLLLALRAVDDSLAACHDPFQQARAALQQVRNL